MDTARGQAHTFEPCGAGWGPLRLWAHVPQ